MLKADAIKFLLEAAGLSASLLAFLKTRHKLRDIDHLIDFINRAYLFTPSTFLEVIQERSPKTLIDNFVSFKENENEVLATGFFKGAVDTPQPVRSVLRRERNLIASKLKAQPLYSNTQDFDGRDYTIKYAHAETFLLKDPRTLSSIVVSDARGCQNQMAFTKIAEKSEFRSFNWIEVLVTRLIWLIQLSLGVLKIYPSFKGFLMGVRTTEHGVELNQPMLTFGTVRLDKANRSLTMDQPLFLLSEKAQMTEFHLAERQRWGRVRSLSLVMSAVFALLLVRRIILVGRRAWEAIQVQIERFRLRRSKRAPEALTDDMKCIICIESPKTVIFKPCLHMALCKACYGALLKNECPICKRSIKSVVNVFLV